MQNFIIAVAAAISLLGGYYLGNIASKNPKQELKVATLLPAPKALSNFNLIDFNNKPFSNNNLKNHWSLLFFGYTNCPDICPTALTSMVEVNKEIININGSNSDLAQQLQTIFISVDPVRDTPEHLKQYVTFFNPNFLAATGEDKELKALSKQLALQFKLQSPDAQGNYLVDHSAWLVVVNPDGQFHAVISGAHYPTPKLIAEDMITIAETY